VCFVDVPVLSVLDGLFCIFLPWVLLFFVDRFWPFCPFFDSFYFFVSFCFVLFWNIYNIWHGLIVTNCSLFLFSLSHFFVVCVFFCDHDPCFSRGFVLCVN